MGFQELLGNEQLKQDLAQAFRRGQIGHFYLLCGPRGSGKHTLARLMAAAAQCESREKPCLTCHSCRKILSGNHPDYITVDDPEKKTVPVDLIRDARADMYIRPNEGNKKIYLFPRAQDMGIPGQNALLKVLEEPPAYGLFLLLTDNPEKLLPTVRSRCTELRLQPLSRDILHRKLRQEFPGAEEEAICASAARSGGYLGQARELLQETEQLDQAYRFLDCFARSDTLGLLKLLSALEKAKRDAFIQELEKWVQLCHEALLCRSGVPSVSRKVAEAAGLKAPQKWNSAIGELKQGIIYAQGNVSVAAICGYLSWALR